MRSLPNERNAFLASSERVGYFLLYSPTLLKWCAQIVACRTSTVLQVKVLIFATPLQRGTPASQSLSSGQERAWRRFMCHVQSALVSRWQKWTGVQEFLPPTSNSVYWSLVICKFLLIGYHRKIVLQLVLLCWHIALLWTIALTFSWKQSLGFKLRMQKVYSAPHNRVNLSSKSMQS